MRASSLRGLLILLASSIVSVSPGLAQFGEESSSPPELSAEAPPDSAGVVIDGRTIFHLRGITSYPAARRAETVAGRIRDLARDPSFDPGTLEINQGEHDSRIGYAAQPTVLRVTDDDADLQGTDRRIYAEFCLGRIRESIVAYRAARTREALISSTWRAGLATILALVTLAVILRVIRSVIRWLERRYTGRVKALSIRSFELVRVERLWFVLRGTLRFVGGISLVVVAVGYLRYTLALFPWTAGAASQIDGWVLAPLALLGSGLLAKIPDLVFLAVLIVIVRYALRVVRLFFSAVRDGKVEFGGFESDWAEPTYKIVRLAIVALAVIVAYPYIPGSSSAAFKGVSLFIGVVFSIGSSSAISNLVAGYALVYRRAFHEGDVVKIGSSVGLVTQARLQVTHLRTPKNEEVIVPNSTILASEVVNYSALAKRDGLILYTTVGIGYETPWRQVEAMLLEAAERTPDLLKEPKPFVLATALGDFAVTYQINVYCADPRGMDRRYSTLHRNILDVFNEFGVQIMTPAYEGDPAEPKLVPRDKWHLPPARES
jgi:small-conductance mechanosensitive channel